MPKDCHPRFSVAILVPYRNRPEHLETFLTFFHNYLQQQRLHYRIFVIEQFDTQPFNRGKLFNIGSQYAAKFGFPCLVLHDVDLIPMNLGNIFACSRDARHLSSSLDSFRFNLPYPELFGGAVTITAENFRVIEMVWSVNEFWLIFRFILASQRVLQHVPGLGWRGRRLLRADSPPGAEDLSISTAVQSLHDAKTRQRGSQQEQKRVAAQWIPAIRHRWT